MKDERIKVSIIIPAYNTEDSIGKCLDSVIAQTYRNIEVIVVNDGSTDGTLNVAKRYENIDARIKVLNQKNTGGIIARKNGIMKASGDYILIEDSDDWLDENLVSRCISVINERKNVDIVKFGYVFEPSGEVNNLLLKNTIKNRVLVGKNIGKIMERLIYHTDCNQIWNEMIKRKLFDFDDKIFKTIVRKGEDLQMNLQIFQKANMVVLLPDNLYHYVNNPDGITNNISAQKMVNNIKDGIYLNEVRGKIAMKSFGYFDKKKVVNSFLAALSGRFIKIVANNNDPQTDLKYIKENAACALADYIGDFSVKDIKQNFFLKMITTDVINQRYDKIIRYKLACKIILKLGLLR